MTTRDVKEIIQARVDRDPELAELLYKAAKHEMSPEERWAQRVSFVMGGLPQSSTLSRKEVEGIMMRKGTQTI